ncbi:hypothetical protein HPB51_004829 [Rhipicephalus microplus]|uniref:Monocarboxylate transporter n=1 Tax=Rhipicephalus microplus TaxID=6941 RepID=A0A9J6EXK4_RHIMP|nr:hypothetical protein HPB51_004829 [Rhipicephalus microplus]
MGIVGSVFLWAGLLGATFAPNMTWMTLTVGLIHGTGVGVVCLTLIVVVMMYFDKYRGIASGMKFAGYSLSSLLYPVILTSLKDAYGFRGALLICAALTMNVTALSLLLKEPPWWTWYAIRTECVVCEEQKGDEKKAQQSIRQTLPARESPGCGGWMCTDAPFNLDQDFDLAQRTSFDGSRF